MDFPLEPPFSSGILQPASFASRRVMRMIILGTRWTGMGRETDHAAMTAGGSNANTFPPMSSATLCTEAWHGTMVDDLGVWPKVVGHSHARTVASRVKRSCASNPERVLQNHCPQTSCVGWEHLLSYIGYDRIVMMMIWLWVKIEEPLYFPRILGDSWVWSIHFFGYHSHKITRL